MSMEFYNPELKTQYIETELCDSPKTTIVNVSGILHSVSVYEHQLNKDVAEFSDDELIKYIINDFCLNRSSSSRKTTLSRLRKYIKWYNLTIKKCVQVPDAIIFQDVRKQNKTHLPLGARNEYYREMWKARYKLADDVGTIEIVPAQKALFKTEDALFQYIQYIFQDDQDDRYVMYKAIAYLAYYGFDAETIRSIEKAEVDKAQHTVQGRKIENDLAFSAILKAVSVTQANGCRYFESPYLIRRISRGRPQRDDLRVPLYAIRVFPKKQREAIDELGATKYQAYVVKFLMMQKYRLFFKIYDEERTYGESVVSSKIIKHEYDEYDIKIQSIEYELWKNNAQDP